MPDPTIETLGDLIDAHFSVCAWCPGGHGFRPFDINEVATRIGRGWRFVGRAWPVRCAVCGSRLMVRLGAIGRTSGTEAQRALWLLGISALAVKLGLHGVLMPSRLARVVLATRAIVIVGAQRAGKGRVLR